MLNLNCVKGMKVITTGDTMHYKRKQSPSCNREKRDGYITIISLHENYIRIGYPGINGKFRYEQVHPYFGGECNA